MRALQFDDFHLFARVAELGTLSAVARERDAPVSQVSRALSRIEKACGARLIHRSTHGLSLTPEGTTFREYCNRMLLTLDELEAEFTGKSREPSGVVRVAASTVIAQYQLLPSLAGLARKHPAIRIELEVGDRLTDLAREGIDIAIRTVNNLPGTVVARQIGSLGRGLYASPAYAKSHGLPASPDELGQHRLVTNSAVTALNQWPFKVKGSPFIFEAEGQLKASDTNMVAAMVVEGLGIGRVATVVGDVLVRKGELVPVLPAFVDPQPSPLYAVTAQARQRLPKIRACIDYWADWFAATAAAPVRAKKAA